MMKVKVLGILLVASLAMATSGCSPRNFNDLNNVDGVSMFYASPLLLKIATAPLSQIPGVNLSKIMDHVGDIRIVSADNPGAIRKTKSVVEHQIKKLHVVPIIEVLGGSIKTNGNGIYVRSSGPADYNQVVIVQSTPSRYQAVFLSGSFTAADLQSISL